MFSSCSSGREGGYRRDGLAFSNATFSNRGHFGARLVLSFFGSTKKFFPPARGKIPRCGLFPPFNYCACIAAVSLIWGGKEAANKNVQFSCLPSCGYKQSSKRQVPTKVNTTQNRVQRIPQESICFVSRQLKISCRVGGGSTTGE